MQVAIIFKGHRSKRKDDKTIAVNVRNSVKIATDEDASENISLIL